MNMKLASLVKRVENPEYTTEPVVSLPYGLAPKQTRSYDHDPSLGYRQPATTNIGLYLLISFAISNPNPLVEPVINTLLSFNSLG